MRDSTLVLGGPRERAIIFRKALAEGRTVSVGYRRSSSGKSGLLEVRDLTGMHVTIFARKVSACSEGHA